MKPKSHDIILRHVDGYGWLPIIERDSKEIFRGEHQAYAHEALECAERWMDERGLDGKA